jgi:hypothetical protein
MKLTIATISAVIGLCIGFLLGVCYSLHCNNINIKNGTLIVIEDKKHFKVGDKVRLISFEFPNDHEWEKFYGAKLYDVYTIEKIADYNSYLIRNEEGSIYVKPHQIVKEALSKPQDLNDPKVAKEFKDMIQKFKGGE